ncbi:hypothetical protein [Sphingomonas sp. HMP6]|uniref:hypothetical protein n=1 Tax=Sphingomonas sp. HMP6 TaxID=1517551 RepID=UPI001596D71A|nr:hypothetical protein [Sphingomonas sp. HMP6]
MLAIAGRAAPKWLTGPVKALLDVGIAIGVIVGIYFAIHHDGEVKGEAKAEGKHAVAHAKVIAAARKDEKAAQVTTDRIGASVARADAQTTDLLKSTIEELHHELAAAKLASPSGAAPVPVDTARLSAPLERGIGSVNRSADAADAQP